MVRIDAYIVQLEIEWEGTDGHVLEFVLVEVRPSPETGVDDVWEALATGYLETTVQGARYGNALGGYGALLLYGCHERVHFVRLVFELLGEGFDGALGKLLVVGRLEVAHERVHD